MNPTGALKAEYVFRPRQILRRLALSARWPSGRVVAQLAWGMPIEVEATENIGRAVLALGVYDLPVAEVLWRLTDPGEVAVDVGANVGSLFAVLVRRTGPSGQAWAFEAHPGLAERLRSNAARWRGWGDVHVVAEAVSSAPGTVSLVLPDGFESNRGLARVGAAPGGPGALTVPATTLDERFAAAPRAPDVLKVDVEGHEEAVIEGARTLLARGHPRDCVYEDHAHPSRVTRLLEASGFTVFRIERWLSRPALVPSGSRSRGPAWEAPSFLATRAPERARARLHARGWRCLRAAAV